MTTNTSAATVPTEVPAETKSPRPAGHSVKRTRAQIRTGNKKPGSVRIQLTLRPEFVETLDLLMQETDATSYSDVMRDAMRVYKWLVLESKKGHQVYVREDDETLTRAPLW